MYIFFYFHLLRFTGRNQTNTQYNAGNTINNNTVHGEGITNNHSLLCGKMKTGAQERDCAQLSATWSLATKKSSTRVLTFITWLATTWCLLNLTLLHINNYIPFHNN
jgi:hypothetical protein